MTSQPLQLGSLKNSGKHSWLENGPVLKMYLLLKMGIFQPAMLGFLPEAIIFTENSGLWKPSVRCESKDLHELWKQDEDGAKRTTCMPENKICTTR